MSVTGTVLPRTGEFYALEFSHSDKEIFQAFLDHANKDISFERLWLVMKSQWFSGFYAKTKDQLIDRLSKALMWLINRKDENTKTCAIPTEL